MCVAVCRYLPAVSQTLVNVLARRHYSKTESAYPQLWRKFVCDELDFCTFNLSSISYRQRVNAVSLVNWHHRSFGITKPDWLALYFSKDEMYREQTIAELDFMSSRVSLLSRRHRNQLIDMATELFAECGIWHASWSSLNF